jgi:hypothetical protein
LANYRLLAVARSLRMPRPAHRSRDSRSSAARATRRSTPSRSSDRSFAAICAQSLPTRALLDHYRSATARVIRTLGSNRAKPNRARARRSKRRSPARFLGRGIEGAKPAPVASSSQVRRQHASIRRQVTSGFTRSSKTAAAHTNREMTGRRACPQFCRGFQHDTG